MKERPILFSGPMVQAIKRGQKSQTRRVVKLPKDFFLADRKPNWLKDIARQVWPAQRGLDIRWLKCPYGQVGDKLWVRECFSYTNDVVGQTNAAIWYWADGNPTDGNWTKPKPSIHMPRWASRITLEIVSVRVERLNLIVRDDVLAEGIERHTKDGELYKYGIDNLWPWKDWENTHVRAYKKLWESINGPQSWEVNPWVWVVEFKRL
jgi:hypothetical protein